MERYKGCKGRCEGCRDARGVRVGTRGVRVGVRTGARSAKAQGCKGCEGRCKGTRVLGYEGTRVQGQVQGQV